MPTLLGVLALTTRRLWGECRSESDELLVAAFATWAVTAIHPFPDANGRVAYDFAHHLLMQRWGQGPLAFPEAGHAALGPALAPLDPVSAGRTVGDFVAATGALVRRLAEATLASLWQTPNLLAVADHLSQAAGRDFRGWGRPR